MLILILILLILPVHAVERRSMEQYSVLRNKRVVLQAELEVVTAQLDRRSPHEIEKCKAELQKAADSMLVDLAELKEAELRREDIDFCFRYNPNVNVHESMRMLPLMYAAQYNTTMVDVLIKAGADVNSVINTTLGPRTTALMLAFQRNRFNTMNVLLNAGATVPYGLDLAAGMIGLRMWQDPNILAYREKMITTVNGANILPAQLSPIIVNYVFGKPPKIDPKTGAAYCSDEEVD